MICGYYKQNVLGISAGGVSCPSEPNRLVVWSEDPSGPTGAHVLVRGHKLLQLVEDTALLYPRLGPLLAKVRSTGQGQRNRRRVAGTTPCTPHSLLGLQQHLLSEVS